VLASPAQHIRQVYDLMATETEEDWQKIAARLSHVDTALQGYIATLTEGIHRGIMPAQRQVSEVANQVREYAKADGFFAEFVSQAQETLPESLQKELVSNAQHAAEAYGRLEVFLKETLFTQAPEQDAVGRDMYELASRHFLGAKIDLDETYEWGKEELARMVAEQESVAQQIKQ